MALPIDPDDLVAFFPKLRDKLSPDRKHIVPEDFDWVFESNYEPKWEEMFRD